MNIYEKVTQIIHYLAGLSDTSAYLTILGVLFVCGLGLPVPEDITLVSAGILAAVGTISLTGAMIVGFVGVLVGDTLLFFLGRRFGRRVFNLPLFRTFFTEARIRRAERKIKANANMICFTARFLPGLRAPIYLTAGTMGVRPLTFFIQDGFAALISVPVWIYVGYWFGQNIDAALKMAEEVQIYFLAAIFTIVIGWVGYSFMRRRKKRKSST